MTDHPSSSGPPPSGEDVLALRAHVALLEAQGAVQREALLDAEDALERLQAQHDVLENFVFGLEREHERANALLLGTQRELEESYRRVHDLKSEQDEIFSNLDLGLLVLGPDHRIQSQHSRAALRMFGRSALAGLPFEDLFEGDRAKEVEAFVDLLFAGSHATDAMFERLNPLREQHEQWAAEGRALSFGFVRVREAGIGEAGARPIAKILVVITDRTREATLRRELEHRMKTQGALIERAWQVLAAPPSLFAEFLAESRAALLTLTEAMTFVAEGGGESTTPLRDLLREAHTLKGNARALELTELADEAHTLESAIVSLRTETDPERRRLIARGAARSLDSMRADLEEDADVYARFGRLRQEVGSAGRDPTTELASLLTRAAELESARRGVQVHVEIVSRVAGELAASHAMVLRNPLLSLVRNAVAHAAEPAPERVGRGKPGVMVVTITTDHHGDDVLTVVRDDGRGIDAAKLRAARGQSDEEVPQSSELLRMVSEPGLSSAEAVDDLGGRGMGMDIVAVGIASLGGRLELDTVAGEYTEFRIWLPRAALVGSAVAPVAVGRRPARAGGM